MNIMVGKIMTVSVRPKCEINEMKVRKIVFFLNWIFKLNNVQVNFFFTDTLV